MVKTGSIQNNRPAIQEKELGKTKTSNSPTPNISPHFSGYNIRNATYEEFCEIVLKLADEGVISRDDASIMMFDPSQSPVASHRMFRVCVTPVNQEGRRDWIAEFEARAKQNMEFGHMGFYNRYRRIAQTLRSL